MDLQNQSKGALRWAPFLFVTFFFVLCQFVAPHPEGQYRMPKIYFYLFGLSSFIPYCLIQDKRWRPFYLFLSYAFLTVLRFQFKWSFFTMEIYFIWLMLIAALERIEYEDKFLIVLYATSIIWIIHGGLQWLNIDPTTTALDPVTRQINRAVQDPVIAFIGNPTWLGPTLAMCIPLVMLKRYGILVAIGLFFISMMTDSSGGMISSIAAVLSMIYLSKWTWKQKLLFTGLLGFILVGIYFLYPMRAIYGSGGWFDENFRFRAWKDAWDFTKQVKWVGWGFGSWLEIFPRVTAVQYHGAVWLQAHNEFVQNYFETGIIGMLFCLWAIFTVILSKPKDRRAYNYLAALITISVDATVMFPWHLPVTAVLTGIALERFFHYSDSRNIIRLSLSTARRFLNERARKKAMGRCRSAQI